MSRAENEEELSFCFEFAVISRRICGVKLIRRINYYILAE